MVCFGAWEQTAIFTAAGIILVFWSTGRCCWRWAENSESSQASLFIIIGNHYPVKVHSVSIRKSRARAGRLWGTCVVYRAVTHIPMCARELQPLTRDYTAGASRFNPLWAVVRWITIKLGFGPSIPAKYNLANTLTCQGPPVEKAQTDDVVETDSQQSIDSYGCFCGVCQCRRRRRLRHQQMYQLQSTREQRPRIRWTWMECLWKGT